MGRKQTRLAEGCRRIEPVSLQTERSVALLYDVEGGRTVICNVSFAPSNCDEEDEEDKNAKTASTAASFAQIVSTGL
jgi:hypothetical protein